MINLEKISYYCINLASASTRKIKIQTQADRASIELAFINAIEGASLDIDNIAYYDRQARRRYMNDLEPNEIACCLSHRLALKGFLAGSANYGVVLEDDAVFPPTIDEDINHILERISGFDVIKLESRDSKGIRIAGGGSLNCSCL